MEKTQEFTRLFALVRETKPLVHHITNYVTVNDCANVTLAIGASPVMADDPQEVEDIAAIASAVVLNIGTLSSRTIESMIAAGKRANAAGTPVVFDPVGAGASKMRSAAAARILREVKVTILRGNLSEVRCVAGLSANTKGVDAADQDGGDAAQIAQDLAKSLGCVTAITGAADIISDGSRTLRITNGHAALSGVTGTGCMCSSLMGAFCGAAPNQPLQAAAAALFSMGIAGEMAYERAGQIGSGSFRVAILDAISQMEESTVEKRGKYEEV